MTIEERRRETDKHKDCRVELKRAQTKAKGFYVQGELMKTCSIGIFITFPLSPVLTASDVP